MFGSDVFTFLQLLLEPTSQLSPSVLPASLDLCRAWCMGPIASRLVLLRALNAFEPELDFARERSLQLTRAAKLPSKLGIAVGQHIAGSGDKGYIPLRSSDHLINLLVLSLNIAAACKTQDLGYAKRCIAGAYASLLSRTF